MQICGTKAVTLVGASEFRKKDLLDCLDFAPTLIAVDGGANNLQDLKILPKYIVVNFYNQFTNISYINSNFK